MPTQSARGFYHLAVNSLGRAWPVFGATSCSNYFNGPFLAPISLPSADAAAPNYTFCNASNELVFLGLVDDCQDGSGLSGAATLLVTGPGAFSSTLTAGVAGTQAIVLPGDYTVTAQAPGSPAQCVNCGRSVCVTVTAADISACTAPLDAAAVHFWAERGEGKVTLRWRLAGNAEAQGFLLERRSLTGDFEPLCHLPSDGGAAYDWVDKAPLTGRSAYRLQFQDADGAWVLGTAVWVDVALTAELLAVQQVGAEVLDVRWAGVKALKVALCDVACRIVAAADGADGAVQLPLTGVASGVYVVRATGDGQVCVRRVLLH
jgi:hypothetical protein